ncbi:MAG: Gfo/Idh/MocA family oxidoreductase [Actinobacteria bacterium]|nr:Gfo/Idh/MocA family oxidoreductase [Actinomycetota bacterium]
MTKWGILGTGKMAAALVDAIREAGGEVAAVGSRAEGTAAAFADHHRIPLRFGTYQALAGLGLDAVYVATTNDRHLSAALPVLREGVAVLCEKPLALDAAQAAAMADAARSSGAFLMEAMWMVFQPAFETLERLIAEGTIGTVHHIRADFGFPADLDPAGRLADPALGGGALLDIGIYPLTLAHALVGPPDRFEAVAVIGPTGVDLQVGVASVHGDVLADLSASFLADASLEAVVSGSGGRLRLHAEFHHSPRITLHRRGEQAGAWDTSYPGSGYRFEVDEVHRCLAAGRLESQRRPLADTLEVMQWMDAIRARIGVVYPGE